MSLKTALVSLLAASLASVPCLAGSRILNVTEAGQLSGADAESAARRPVAEPKLCGRVWDRLSIDDANPFELLGPAQTTWVLDASVAGRHYHVMPSAFRKTIVDWTPTAPAPLGAQPQQSVCLLPTAWRAESAEVVVATAPALDSASMCYRKSVVSDSLCREGYELRGGILLHREESLDASPATHSFRLFWALLAQESTAGIATALAETVGLPESQPLAVGSVLDHHAAGSSVVRALRFSMRSDFSDAGPWLELAHAPGGSIPAYQLFPTSLPVFSPPTDLRARVQAAATAFQAPDLSVFEPASAIHDELYPAFDGDGRTSPLYVRLLWSPGSGLGTYLTSFSVSPDGQLVGFATEEQ